MSAALHILAASRALPFHGIGGMESMAWDLLTELARRGHRVTVLTAEVPDSPPHFTLDGVRVLGLPGASSRRYTAQWWRASRDCGRAVHRDEPVDAVLSVSVAAAGLLPLRREGLRAPYLFQAHGTSWGELLSKWRSRRAVEIAKSARNAYWLLKDVRLYRSFDHLVLVGEGLRRQIDSPPLRWLTRAVPRSVIHNGVDTTRFRPDTAARARVRATFGWEPQERVAVFCGRLHVQKGAATAIAASAALNAGGFAHRLLLIGGGPEEAALRGLARTAARPGSVHFTGPVPRSKLPELLATCDALIFPTRRQEANPMNVLEALATGLRCVCSETLRGVLASLPVAFAPATDLPHLQAALRSSLVAGASPVSLLPAQYSLQRCADSYLQVINRLRAH